MATNIRGTDGNVALPAFSGNDLDTGVYFPSAGNVAIATNGVNAVTINESQNATFANAVTATSFSGSGASVTSLNASNISSGTVATARLGSGTANSTTYLRGDQTWATVSGGVTSLNGETGAITNTGLGAIGSYFVGFDVVSIAGNSTTAAGATLAGSDLRIQDLFSANSNYMQSSFFTVDGSGSFIRAPNGGTASLSGTWRRMGPLRNTSVGALSSSATGVPSLYVRIS